MRKVVSMSRISLIPRGGDENTQHCNEGCGDLPCPSVIVNFNSRNGVFLYLSRVGYIPGRSNYWKGLPPGILSQSKKPPHAPVHLPCERQGEAGGGHDPGISRSNAAGKNPMAG